MIDKTNNYNNVLSKSFISLQLSSRSQLKKICVSDVLQKQGFYKENSFYMLYDRQNN